MKKILSWTLPEPDVVLNCRWEVPCLRSAALVAILWAVPLMAQDTRSQILQIYRDPVKPGREDAYRAIEEEAARICARLAFPNPHLALESLTGPKEVWWLNAFVSEAERQRVTDDYKGNSALVAALEGIATRKQGLTGAPVDVLTTYRADLSGGVPWNPAGARFFVVTVTKQGLQARASVFAAPDGTRHVLRPVRTHRQAEVEAAALGGETRVFAVRPYWGMPAKEWIAADPEFWSANPMARRE